jgi:hypothetical protein
MVRHVEMKVNIKRVSIEKEKNIYFLICAFRNLRL